MLLLLASSLVLWDGPVWCREVREVRLVRV